MGIELAMTQKTLVEVSVKHVDGSNIPYGIMNSDQAAELCDNTFKKDVLGKPTDDLVNKNLTEEFLGARNFSSFGK